MIIKNIGIVVELNQLRKRIDNSFHETIPVSSILVSLTIIDDIILKIHDNDIENFIEIIHDLRENILYMLSFEKLLRDNDGELITEDEHKEI